MKQSSTLLNNMIIGIDANQANKALKSGVEWYAWHLIDQFKKLSQDNPYKKITFRLYSSTPLEGELAKLPENFESRVLPWINIGTWNLWTQIRLSFELIKNPPDAFFAPGFTIPFLHPAKSIVTIHDLGFIHVPEYYPTVPKLYYKLLTWLSTKSAWKVITPSEYTKKDVASQYGFPAERIEVTELGYDLDHYKPLKKEEYQIVLDQYGLSAGYILFIGRLMQKKNILRVVQSFHELVKKNTYQDIKLVLGGNPHTGWETAERYIRENSLESKIKVLGYVPEEHKAALMNGAKVFLFPSLFEGFGIPVLEAMACGVPVITSTTTSLAEVAGDAAKTVNPEDLSAITNELENIISDQSLQKLLSEKGRIHALRYSWDNTARKTLNVLMNE